MSLHLGIQRSETTLTKTDINFAQQELSETKKDVKEVKTEIWVQFEAEVWLVFTTN